MTLLFVDGCSQVAGINTNRYKWTGDGRTEYHATNGRRSAGCIYRNGTMDSATYVYKDFATTGWATGIVGCAMKFDILPSGSGAVQLFSFKSTTDVNVSAWYLANGTVGIYRGGDTGSVTQLAVSSVLPWVINNWYYLEFKATINGSTGSAYIRRDGVTVASVTGANTLAGGTAEIRRVKIWGGAANTVANGGYACDIYIADTNGTENNDFLGDIRVETLRVTADGTTNAWTPSAGANYTCVDETSFNTTDYVDSSTVGQIDLYTISDLSYSPDPIYAVQVCAASQRTEGVFRQIKGKARISAANYDIGGTMTLLDAWFIQHQVQELSPATSSAWTEAEINGAEFGVETVA